MNDSLRDGLLSLWLVLLFGTFFRFAFLLFS